MSGQENWAGNAIQVDLATVTDGQTLQWSAVQQAFVNVSGSGVNLSVAPPIGNTTPNTGAFTTLSAASLGVTGTGIPSGGYGINQGSASSNVSLWANSTLVFAVDKYGNVIMQGGAIATNAVNGFIYPPYCAGVPTGTPAATVGYGYTGPQVVFNSTTGQWYWWNGSAWAVVSSTLTGSFTGTLTGFSGTAPSGTIYYSINGNLVTLSTHGVAITGTSNATSFTMTGLPAALQPAHAKDVACGGFEDNTTTNWFGACSFGASSGTITFAQGLEASAFIYYSAAGWVNTGTKGLMTTWTVTYSLD